MKILLYMSIAVAAVGVRTPQKNQSGVSDTPTILVCLVTCNWLLNCTTGIGVDIMWPDQ